MEEKEFKTLNIEQVKEQLIETGLQSENFKKAIEAFGFIFLTADNSVKEYEVLEALCESKHREENQEAAEVLSSIGLGTVSEEAAKHLSGLPFDWDELDKVKAQLFEKGMENTEFREAFNKHAYIILSRSDVDELGIEGALLSSSRKKAEDILQKTTYLHGVAGSESREEEDDRPYQFIDNVEQLDSFLGNVEIEPGTFPNKTKEMDGITVTLSEGTQFLIKRIMRTITLYNTLKEWPVEDTDSVEGQAKDKVCAVTFREWSILLNELTSHIEQRLDILANEDGFNGKLEL